MINQQEEVLRYIQIIDAGKKLVACRADGFTLTTGRLEEVPQFPKLLVSFLVSRAHLRLPRLDLRPGLLSIRLVLSQ